MLNVYTRRLTILTNHPGHDNPDAVRYLVHVRHAIGVQEFVGYFLLSDDDGRVRTSYPDGGCGALVDGLESVLYQIIRIQEGVD